jgi:putative transposase
MHLKLDKLISKSVNGITIQLYASLIAYLILQLISIPAQWGNKLLDKIPYLQACMCQKISFVIGLRNSCFVDFFTCLVLLYLDI